MRFIIRIDQQVDRVVVDVLRQAVLDGDDQGGQAAFGPAFRQALGVGVDRRLGLPVEQAGGRPPQEHRKRGGAGGQQQGIDHGEAEAGGTEQAAGDHAASGMTGRSGAKRHTPSAASAERR